MFIYGHDSAPLRPHTTPCMVKKKSRYPRFFGLKITEADYDLLPEYKRENRHPTKSAAARDLIRRQARYARWQRSRRRKEARTEEDLRNIAREILRDHPDASIRSLGWNMTKSAGKIVDAELIKRIVDEMSASG